MSRLAYFDPESAAAKRRTTPRKTLRLLAEGVTASGAQTQVLIHDVSEEGLLLESSVILARGEMLDVIMPDLGATRATVVWNVGHFFVCQFKEPVPVAAATAALLAEATTRKSSDEALFQAACQLEDLSMAVLRLGRVVDRAIGQLLKDRKG